MKRLTEIEQRAINWLFANGPYTPSDDQNEAQAEIVRILDGLVKAKRVLVFATDGIPKYTLSSQGLRDAS